MVSPSTGTLHRPNSFANGVRCFGTLAVASMWSCCCLSISRHLKHRGGGDGGVIRSGQGIRIISRAVGRHVGSIWKLSVSLKKLTRWAAGEHGCTAAGGLSMHQSPTQNTALPCGGRFAFGVSTWRRTSCPIGTSADSACMVRMRQ